MAAPSDGAIVIHVPTSPDLYKPRFRTVLRWYVPDMVIALWLGALAGSFARACMP